MLNYGISDKAGNPERAFTAILLVFCRRFFVRELPTHLTQRNELSNQPRLRAVPVRRLLPVLRLRHALAVEFEDEFGMAGGEDVGVHVLVAGHAGVGADVKVLQVAHPGVDAVGVRVILARVRTNPVLRRAVAVLARDAVGNLHGVSAVFGGDGLHRCVADGATRGLRGIAELQRLRDAFAACRGERGERALVMDIVFCPDGVLTALVVRAAVAAARGTGLRAEKFGSFFRANIYREQQEKNKKLSREEDEGGEGGQKLDLEFLRNLRGLRATQGLLA